MANNIPFLTWVQSDVYFDIMSVTYVTVNTKEIARLEG